MKNSNSIRTDQPGNDKNLDNSRLDVKLLRSRTDELSVLALEATSDGIWAWHIPSGETYFSPRYYTMLGYEPDELPAHYDTWVSLLHPEDREQGGGPHNLDNVLSSESFLLKGADHEQEAQTVPT